MSNLVRWHDEVMGRKAVDALIKNNFSGKYFSSRADAVDYIMQLIPDDTTIGVGGSKTLLELGLVSDLEKRGHEIFNHNKEGLNPEEKAACRYRQLTCDIFLSGTNAITLTGEIVNRDAFGNRVAAMIFGPKKVIIVVGVNKIVKDIVEADRRIKMRAAPMNNKKYELPNPCIQTGECMDCDSSKRLCNITTILSRRPPLTDIHVIVVGDNLGF